MQGKGFEPLERFFDNCLGLFNTVKKIVFMDDIKTLKNLFQYILRYYLTLNEKKFIYFNYNRLDPLPSESCGG